MPERTGAGRRDGFVPNLGTLIRRRREELDVTQTALAIALGVDQSRVSRWEAGDRVDPRRLPALADWLEIDLDDALRLNFYGADRLEVSRWSPEPISTITLFDLDGAVEHVAAAALLGLRVALRNDELSVVVGGEEEITDIWVVTIFAEAP